MKIESAGGVVFRQMDQQVQILLIQDRFGYWTFPKGKKEAGETDEQTALREIWEETRVSGKIVQSLISTVYQYESQGQQFEKTVTYFLIQYKAGLAKPQLEEIRQANWFSLEQAETLLREQGYANNLPVLQAAKKALHSCS